MRTLALCCWSSLAALLPAQTVDRDLAGRVVDEAGGPLAGVAVCLLDSRAPGWITAELVQHPLATTAADGSYAALLPASCGAGSSLLFVVRGHVHVSTPLHPHDGWPVVLPRANTLAGRVVDARGEPVAGVRVEARDWLRTARYRANPSTATWLPEPRTAVRSDARGRFVIPGAVAAGVSLIADLGRGETGPVGLGEPIEIVLRAPAGDAPMPAEPAPSDQLDQLAAEQGDGEPTTLRVTAVDADGAPVAAFRCAAVRTVGGEFRHFEWRAFDGTAVDAVDGVAELLRPPATGPAHSLLAVAPGMAAARIELDAAAREAVVHFAAEVTLRGTVVDQAGEPIAGADVWLCRGPDQKQLEQRWAGGGRVGHFDSHWGHVLTGADGAFALHHVGAGLQHLLCTKSGFAPPLPLMVEPALGVAIEDLRIVMPRLQGVVGTLRLPRMPVRGASIRFLPAHVANGIHAHGPSGANYDEAACVAADGSFHLPPIPPGDYLPQLVLARPLQQGAPDIVDLEPVTISEGNADVVLDARTHAPGVVRGTVRGFVPSRRLLVGASIAREAQASFYGFAFYECALATVGHDGAYRLEPPAGECTVFVIDLLTGMLLRRDAPRDLEAGRELVLDLRIEAGACDVELVGRAPNQIAWLEMVVADEWWPAGIDRMKISRHQFTKRIGCFLRPGQDRVRLYLPPLAADLWLVEDRNGKLDGARGEAAIEVFAGEGRAATIELPR